MNRARPPRGFSSLNPVSCALVRDHSSATPRWTREAIRDWEFVEAVISEEGPPYTWTVFFWGCCSAYSEAATIVDAQQEAERYLALLPPRERGRFAPPEHYLEPRGTDFDPPSPMRL